MKYLIPLLTLLVSFSIAQAADPVTNTAPTPAPPAAKPPAPPLTVAPEKPSGVYTTGDKIVWNIKAAPEVHQRNLANSQPRRRRDEQGRSHLHQWIRHCRNHRHSTRKSAPRSPGHGADPAAPPVLGGALIDQDKILPSAPVPEDFDTFWNAKIAELKAIPINPVLTKGDSGHPGVDYWKITMDNVKGTHIQGQLARPTVGEKFPALLIVQYYGIYALQKYMIMDPASKGWARPQHRVPRHPHRRNQGILRQAP